MIRYWLYTSITIAVFFAVVDAIQLWKLLIGPCDCQTCFCKKQDLTLRRLYNRWKVLHFNKTEYIAQFAIAAAGPVGLTLLMMLAIIMVVKRDSDDWF